MYRQRTANKYHAESVYFDGHKYDSKAEAAHAEELSLLLKAGEIKSWRPHVLLRLEVDGHHICDYEIDFEVTHHDGHIEYQEVKGMQLPAWKQKWRLLEATHEKVWPGSTLALIRVYGRAPRWNSAAVKSATRRVMAGRKAYRPT